MRMILSALALLALIQTPHSAYAGSKDPVTYADNCTASKMSDLKNVSASNIGSMINRHFSINSLGAQIIGGVTKWKNDTIQRDAIKGLFSDDECLNKLYDEFKDYRTTNILSYLPTDIQGKSIVEVMTSDGKKQLSINYGKNCSITLFCKAGGGCTHEAFRHYCTWKGK